MPTAPLESWEPVLTAVNAWRGACIHHFSVAEAAVTETLLALHAAAGDGQKVPLRHLIGQRFDDLAAAIAESGPFAEVGKPARAPLAHFRAQHEPFRTLLCHGSIKVAAGVNGHWLVVIRTLTLRAGRAERAVEVLEQAEALARLAAMKQDGQRLCAHLGQVRKRLVRD